MQDFHIKTVENEIINDPLEETLRLLEGLLKHSSMYSEDKTKNERLNGTRKQAEEKITNHMFLQHSKMYSEGKTKNERLYGTRKQADEKITKLMSLLDIIVISFNVITTILVTALCLVAFFL